MATRNYRDYLYTDDDGETHQIRINTSTVAAQPTAPTQGASTSKIQAKSSAGKRQFGMKPRYVRLSRVAGTSPDEKTYYTNLPILAVADLTTLTKGSVKVVDGVTWTVGNGYAEQQR